MESGLFTAYIALGVMAVVPIYIGSRASIKYPKSAGKKSDGGKEEEEEEPEFFSMDDAKWFPVIGSITLFSLYLIFKFFDKEHINYVVTTYFTCLGVAAGVKTLMTVARGVTGWQLKGDYHLQLLGKDKKDSKNYKRKIISEYFGIPHVISLLLSLALGAYYAYTKHWLVSNFYGEAFATSAIQLLNIDSFATGMILLSGLFFYDIFWVFGTEVMVTVAKNFDAPIKVVFPKDILELVANGLFTKSAGNVKFTMLGLGDIVIPGIFVALCLQFDYDQYKKTEKGKKQPNTMSFPKPYFISCFIAYFLGLVTTVVVMHNFQAAQPALLYLSPACIFSALITAAARGEIKDMFAFAPNAENEKKTKAAASKADKGVEKTTEEKKKDSDEEASPTGSNGSPTRRSTRGKKKN